MRAKKRITRKDGNKLYAMADIVPPGPGKAESKGSKGKPQSGTASHCIDEIQRYEKKFKTWEERAREIVRRYRDERDKAQLNTRSFNVLWSNVQILKPTLYARVPKPEVIRRFKDNDPVARTAAEIAERATDVEIDFCGLNEVLDQCVDDRLLGGRGQAWVSYEGEFKKTDEESAKVGDGLRVEYVDYRDFGHTPVNIWSEVTKVWRWKYFDRESFTARFGGKYVDRVEFSQRQDRTSEQTEYAPEARVAEVWDKKTGRVYWVSKSVPDYLDEYDDPLKLQGFFPCPRPLYATMTNDTLEPVPDFYLYQDQANEIDKLTGRINRLTDALKVVGVCDRDVKELQTLLDPRGVGDNTIVPVNMTDLTGKGGILNSVQIVDLTPIITTLQAAYVSRQQALNSIYEITGISDVIRGATDPNETAEAQRIKSQFGGTRIRDMQQEVARFSRDVIRLMAEIIVEMYDPMTLWEMTNAVSFVGVNPQTGQPDVAAFAEALKLLKSDRLRSFRVDIETDSTIALDEAEAKQEAGEFITAVGGFMQQAFQVIQAEPAMAPLAGEMLLFVARRYKAGRTMEGAIETAVQNVLQAAQAPKPPPPEVLKAQAQTQAIQQKGQIQLQLGEQKIAQNAQEHQQTLQFERTKFALELDQDQQKHDQELIQQAQSAAVARRAQALKQAQPANRRPA